MICGQLRFFDEISVAHRPLPPEHANLDTHANVSYCNDQAECIAAATVDGPWPLLPEAS
jgi:hypothetical protein